MFVPIGRMEYGAELVGGDLVVAGAIIVVADEVVTVT